MVIRICMNRWSISGLQMPSHHHQRWTALQYKTDARHYAPIYVTIYI